MYTHLYAYKIYTYKYSFIYVYIYMYICVYICIHIYIYIICVHIYIYIYIYMYIYIYIYTYIHIYLSGMHVSMRHVRLFLALLIDNRWGSARVVRSGRCCQLRVCLACVWLVSRESVWHVIGVFVTRMFGTRHTWDVRVSIDAKETKHVTRQERHTTSLLLRDTPRETRLERHP